MPLPVLHPEKVLGTRGPRGVWSHSSIMSMEDFLRKKIKVATYDSVKVAATVMLGFKQTRNCFSFSDKFDEESSKRKWALAKSTQNFCEKGGELYGCALLDSEHCFYFRAAKSDNPSYPIHISAVTHHSVQGDLMLSFSVQVRCLGEDNLNGELEIKLPKAADKAMYPYLQATVESVINLVGYYNDSTIIPHFARESTRSPSPDSNQDAHKHTERYSIPITYVTPATFKDRHYRILNSGVKGHVRKQRVGPGRLQVKDVFVREHSRSYGGKS